MVPIPEGSENHSEDPISSDYGESQEDLDQPGELMGSGSCHIPQATQKALKEARELRGQLK